MLHPAAASAETRFFPVANSRAASAALCLITAFFLLYGLGAYGVMNDNESLYAVMAREMLESGSFGIPTLNGVPYLEKPPLLAWLVAVVYAIAGESELTSRLVPAIAAFVLVAAVASFVGMYVQRSIGWLTGLILASSFLQAVIFRTLLPETLLVLFFTLSMLAFFDWHARRRSASLIVSYACLGMAVLAKGFVAIALGAAVFAIFGLVAQRSWRMRELLHPQAVGVLVFLAAAWPVYLAIKDPDYAWFYVINEHVLRYLGLREPHDYYGGPLYYYLPRILLFLFPWSVFFPLLATGRRGTAMSDLEKLAWIWFGVTLLFFSLSSAKGNYYMSVAMPALAFLLAIGVAGALERGRENLLLALIAVPVAAIVLAVVALHTDLWVPEGRRIWKVVFEHEGALKLGLLAFAGLAALAGVLLVARLHGTALCVLALANAPLLELFVDTAHRADRYVSHRALAAYVSVHYPGEQVFLFQDYEKFSSLPFYLGRSLPVVDSHSNDLAFGRRRVPGSPSFAAPEQFAAIASKQPVVLIVHRRRLDAYRHQLGKLGLHHRARIGPVNIYTRD